MRKIIEILRLHFDHRLSQRQIARSTTASQSTIHLYLTRFQASGLPWPLPESLSEDELQAALFPTPVAKSVSTHRPLPDFPQVSQELRRKHVTMQLLWEEYRAAHPDGYCYSRFCLLFDQWQKNQHPTMRQIHRAGEKLFVDWAGSTIPLLDRETGQRHDASLFLAVLGASSYTYAEATANQQMESWNRRRSTRSCSADPHNSRSCPECASGSESRHRLPSRRSAPPSPRSCRC